MKKQEAKLELFKLDRQIEKKITEHKNELGQYNKSIVMEELEVLWSKKAELVEVAYGKILDS